MNKSIYDKRVKEFLTRELVTLHVDDTIHDALALMGENRVSALPVVDGRNRCVGVLSTADLVDLTHDFDEDMRQLDLASGKIGVDSLTDRLGSEKVEAYMSASVTTVGLETLIGKAAQEMLRNRVHHLPVVDHNERLMGIISTMDILSEFVDAAPVSHDS
jgi:CBS domain-containing protein